MADITNNDILNAIRGLYQNNPNRVQDITLQQKVDQMKAELEDIYTKLGGTINVALTGRNVVTVPIFNAVAVNTTTFTSSGLKNLSNLRDIHLIALSTLDKPISLTLRLASVNDVLYVYDPETSQWVSRSVVLPAYTSGKVYALNTAWPIFNNGNPGYDGKFSISYKCDELPTTGSLSVFAMGVPN